MEKKNVSSDGRQKKQQQHQNAEQNLLENLPSEQDRKAIMGCLAAVLNIMYAARQRKYIDTGGPDAVVSHSESSSNLQGGVSSIELSKSKSGQEDDDVALKEADDDDAVVNFSIRKDDNEHTQNASSTNTGSISSSWSMNNSTAQQQKQMATIRRTKAFQQELLNVSAELLFLSPDHAAVFLPNLDIVCVDDAMEQELLLRPFLDSLSSSEESFRCIAVLMFRFLLLSSEGKPTATEKKNGNNSSSYCTTALEKMTIVGYDARVRFAFKHLAVSVLSFWDLKEHANFVTPKSTAAHATRKFEALEDGIALRLSILSQILTQEKNTAKNPLAGQKKPSSFSKSAIRGLKIGAAGVAAGTVFAITGGLAAPAIIGGIAALTGVGSAVSVIATVLLLPAATTIFGVGGGSLVASKMSKRTAGLNDFDIEKITTADGEDVGDSGKTDCKKKSSIANNNPELSRTICISGWLRDEHDYERPFGISPRTLTDYHELFCRYCSVYAPQIIPKCRDILKEWLGKEGELWDMCRASCGKDPSSLLPFETGPRYDALLTEGENEAVDNLIRAMGLPFPMQSHDKQSPQKDKGVADIPAVVNLLSDVLVSSSDVNTSKNQMSDAMLRYYKAWDFHAEYGSELYIIKWEKDLLLELNGSVKAFQRDLAKKAAGEALKKTAMASLMAAVFVPAALLSLSNIIDERWTIVVERSDEAGVLLAQSLLNSNAGHRPVTLIGFSFGARMIVACLKELARNQAIWVRQQEGNKGTEMNEGSQTKAASFRQSLSNMSNKQKEAQVVFRREPASIIEDVILMGCPASVNKATWMSCREVVAGRLINCYSQNDMILALMYRVKNLTSLLSPPVGISHVNMPGIENYDVSGFVASHGEYCDAVREILNLVGYNMPVDLKAGVD